MTPILAVKLNRALVSVQIMRSRLSDFVETLRALSDGKWISLRNVRDRVPFNLSYNDLLELSRRGLIDTYVDLASGEVYVKVKQVISNDNVVNVNEIVDRIISELKEPMPKPAFEELLKKITGDEWSRVYSELINKGIIREMEFNGMVFLAVAKQGGEQAQDSGSSSK